MIRVLAATVLVAAMGMTDGRLTEREGVVQATPKAAEPVFDQANGPRGASPEGNDGGPSSRSVSRRPAHFGHPDTWFTRQYDGGANEKAAVDSGAVGQRDEVRRLFGMRLADGVQVHVGVEKRHHEGGVSDRLPERALASDRHLAHYGHPGTWFTRHASDADKARILRGRIKHAADVLRFFDRHPRLVRTEAGRNVRWQHRRMGRWARRELKRVLWSPPLLQGEREWHASMRNPTNRNLWRLAVCETGGINGGRPLWTHQNSVYGGALGFLHATWRQFRVEVKPLPPRHSYDATAGQQLAVGRALVRRFGGYSSWPSCSIRMGLR